MREPQEESSLEQLTQRLNEKRNLYNQMLGEDKEFEQVKTLFVEIRELEKSLQGWQVKTPENQPQTP